eukprot:GHVH01001960.1.p1 GENE.GHVH01001960.1~~GHVH01001960.1.p1  ORF type:complete len:415 (-),score=60.36 GHVH01001960.1:689-1933(-)
MSGDDLCSRYGGSSSLMVEEPKQKIDKLILDSGIEGEFYSIKINPKFTPKVHDKIEKIVEPISLKLIRYPRNMNYGVASAIVKMCFYLKIPLIIFDAEESSWRVPTCSTTPEFELLHGDMTISRISIAVRYIAEVVAPEYHSSKLIEEKITTRTSPTEVENLIQQIERQYRYLMWMNRETGPMSFGADSRRLRTRESFEIAEVEGSGSLSRVLYRLDALLRVAAQRKRRHGSKGAALFVLGGPRPSCSDFIFYSFVDHIRTQDHTWFKHLAPWEQYQYHLSFNQDFGYYWASVAMSCRFDLVSEVPKEISKGLEDVQSVIGKNFQATNLVFTRKRENGCGEKEEQIEDTSRELLTSHKSSQGSSDDLWNWEVLEGDDVLEDTDRRPSLKVASSDDSVVISRHDSSHSEEDLTSS